jgi:hypothetical protein
MFRRQPRAIFKGVFKPNFLLRRRVDAGQNTRGTPAVNHDSGVGANEKKTTEQQLHNILYLTEGQLSKKFGLKTPLKMARGWRRNMSGNI